MESVVRAWLDIQFFQNGRVKSEEEILDDMEALEREEKRLENEVKRLEQERKDLEKQNVQEAAKTKDIKKSKISKEKQTIKSAHSKSGKKSKTKKSVTDKKALKGQRFQLENLDAPKLESGSALSSLPHQDDFADQQNEPVGTEDIDIEEESDEEESFDFGSLVKQSQSQTFTSVAEEEKIAAETMRASANGFY